MKRILLLLLLLPVLAWAQSPFDGTWKVDMSKSKFPKKPDEYMLKDGMYECKTCKPELKVKADGQMQAVSGHPYFDMFMVKVVDEKHVEMASQKSGKDVGKSSLSVSADGNTLTETWTYYGNPEGGPVTGTSTSTRVGKMPAGANAISGAWRNDKIDVATGDALIFTYKTSGGDSLSMSSPTGQSYSAKLDGKEVPFVGDPGTTGVSLKRVGDAIEETDYRDGKAISVSKMTVSADGKTMTMEVDDKLHGTKATYFATKQ
ncbi:MAG TPA: hypothetical protein VMT53_16165 [Terriglobales bacterium]|nr:hypothetical protein [Terriglobales bacterium]